MDPYQKCNRLSIFLQFSIQNIFVSSHYRKILFWSNVNPSSSSSSLVICFHQAGSWYPSIPDFSIFNCTWLLSFLFHESAPPLFFESKCFVLAHFAVRSPWKFFISFNLVPRVLLSHTLIMKPTERTCTLGSSAPRIWVHRQPL